ncbi:MAG: MotA/TolQ/ExbB proton channel family protein [Planctomycetes bacterium]|nr:MotA/TolQ/ExbB proton channel family protein [Planctomycetota bacterium]MBI3835883.1 MotA/TolQ/ExbB proton channel family protein [Planctomycetota bacterium]
MDIASLIGSLLGIVLIGVVAAESCHGHWAMFYSLEGVLLVFGGSISVCFMALPMEKVKSVPGFVKRFIFAKGKSPVEVIKLMSTLAEKSRRDGILALESEFEHCMEVDPFLAAGVRMTIDGLDSATVEQTLRLEILAMQDRHKAGKKFFDLLKLYGPGYGLVGTLIGQIGMFGNLSGGDVGTMGHNLAVAVCATMYGTVLANAIAGPIGDKLALRSGEEILNREMMLQGITSIQAGDNPRITVDKMAAFLPKAGREKLKAA